MSNLSSASPDYSNALKEIIALLIEICDELYEKRGVPDSHRDRKHILALNQADRHIEHIKGTT